MTNKRNISDYLSNKIYHIYFICSILVVFIHFYDSSYAPNPAFRIEQIIEDMISQGIARCAVPLFFILSGFLAFSVADCSPKQLIQSIPKKIIRLLVPYLIWNIIYYSFTSTLQIINHTYTFDFVHLLKSLFLYELTPFWYLFQLMILHLISPILFFPLKKIWSASLLIALFMVGYFVIIKNTKWFLLPGILFFSIGAAFALLKPTLIDFSLYSKAMKRLSIIFGCVLFAGLLIFRFSISNIEVSISDLRDTPLYRLSELIFPFSVWLFADLFNIGKFEHRHFEDRHFNIYCCHGLLITIVNILIKKMITEVTPNIRLILYITCPLAISFLIVLLFFLIERFLPFVYRLLSGKITIKKETASCS